MPKLLVFRLVIHGLSTKNTRGDVNRTYETHQPISCPENIPENDRTVQHPSLLHLLGAENRMKGSNQEERNERLHRLGLESGDYYLTKEGYIVFTEQYHRKRGYCCQSGCRHCPYDKTEIKPKGSAG